MKKTSGFDAKRLAYAAICVAFSMVLSYIESLLPVWIPVPGVKLGLANIAVVFLLYRSTWGDALCVSLLRVGLSALLFGSFVSLLYSACGALFSFFAMLFVKKSARFSVIGVSVVGGVMHNVGQTVAACFVLSGTALLYYLPVLLIFGVFSGVLIGVLAGLVFRRVK